MTEPSKDRWMLFVDGESLLYRGLAISRKRNVSIGEGPQFCKDALLWMPGRNPLKRFSFSYPPVGEYATRATYYTSVCGDEAKLGLVREYLWRLHFDPCVFKKIRKEEKAKGVDVALTRDLLTHAFRGNYDTAVIMTGDADYVPVLEEVKRLGKRVHIVFFNGEVPLTLKTVADHFFDIEKEFVDRWTEAPSGGRVDCDTNA